VVHRIDDGKVSDPGPSASIENLQLTCVSRCHPGPRPRVGPRRRRIIGPRAGSVEEVKRAQWQACAHVNSRATAGLLFLGSQRPERTTYGRRTRSTHAGQNGRSRAFRSRRSIRRPPSFSDHNAGVEGHTSRSDLICMHAMARCNPDRPVGAAFHRTQSRATV
jgi:hypothetical protein